MFWSRVDSLSSLLRTTNSSCLNMFSVSKGWPPLSFLDMQGDTNLKPSTRTPASAHPQVRKALAAHTAAEAEEEVRKEPGCDFGGSGVSDVMDVMRISGGC